MLLTSAIAIGPWSGGRSVLGLELKNNITSRTPSAPKATMMPSGFVDRWSVVSGSPMLRSHYSHFRDRPIVRVVVLRQLHSQHPRRRRRESVPQRHIAGRVDRPDERQAGAAASPDFRPGLPIFRRFD